jgi:hypothetical protein
MNNQTASNPTAFLECADLLAFKEKLDKSVSDKLSETLARHTVVLDDELKHRELCLRQELLDGISNFDDCRENEGRIFFEYCEIYKAQRLWTKVGTAIGLRFGYSLKTVERMRDRHKEKIGLRQPREKMLKKASDPLLDEGETNVLSRQNEELLIGRYHLREAVVPFSGLRLIDVLTQLINAEAFSSWGFVKPFTMYIEPGPSPVVITSERRDGETCSDESQVAGDPLNYVN